VAEQKTCFVVSPIGEEGSPIRKRADQTFRHLVAPVVEARGYEAVRSDHMTRPGLITSQVLQEVAEAALVVADLTGHNPNVFYELAIRHATRQPIVQLISSEDELPFDIAAMRTIFFDIHDLDSVEQARKDLDGHVSGFEEDASPVETPISAALGITALRESDEPLAQVVGDLAAEVGNLRAEIKRERSRVAGGEISIQGSHVTPSGAITFGSDPFASGVGSGAVRLAPIQPITAGAAVPTSRIVSPGEFTLMSQSSPPEETPPGSEVSATRGKATPKAKGSSQSAKRSGTAKRGERSKRTRRTKGRKEE
jgi:hypothetical protein